MKILSLNALDGELREELKGFLESQLDDTDVFCFQETIGESIETLLAELFPETNYWITDTEKTTNGNGQYNLFTAVKKPLQISNSQALLSTSDEEVGQALATNIISPDSGFAFTIVNVHGVPLPGDKLDNEGRLRQSETIIRWLSENSISSAVICGDFNLLPETESVKKFTQTGFQDLIANYKIPTTRNELAWIHWPNSIQLFADYTFVSPQLNVTSFEVPNTKVSDHLPMVIDIES